MTINFNESNNACTLERICPISISETDCNHKIKTSVLFNFMQDLAAKSIDTYGHQYSCDGLAKNGLGWFIIRYRVEFDEYPKDVKEIKLQTESRGCQRMTSFRDFEIFDNESGERILRAASSWFIVNLENKSVVNIAQEFPNFLRYEKRDDDLVLQKLKTLGSVDGEKVFKVRYEDMDINNHVNNVVYITWALEALDYDFRCAHNLKTIDVYFKHDVKYGEEIISQVKYDYENLATEHLIKNKNTGDELCLLKVTYY